MKACLRFFFCACPRRLTTLTTAGIIAPMSDIIYPRSPRETMCGWMHLPRFVDKIRLHQAGRLHPDYQANFCKGFDGRWLEDAGVEATQFIEVVSKTITDGEVCDWVCNRWGPLPDRGRDNYHHDEESFGEAKTRAGPDDRRAKKG